MGFKAKECTEIVVLGGFLLRNEMVLLWALSKVSKGFSGFSKDEAEFLRVLLLCVSS